MRSVMLPTRDIMGIPIAVGDVGGVTGEIMRLVCDGRSGYVCVGNVHMVVTASQSADFTNVLRRARLVTADGVPLVWELRRKGERAAERVAGPDLMLRLCRAAAEEGTPVYLYGGSQRALAALRTELKKEFPLLRIAGWESPPQINIPPEVDPQVAKRINDSGAKLVFVSLGCPKQELWMAAYAPLLSAVCIGVGAAFGFLSNSVPRAPFWMQRNGLEWLFRLLVEPRRLWKRYLITNTLFVWYLIRQVAGNNSS